MPLKWAVETQEAHPSTEPLTGNCFQMEWRFPREHRKRAKGNRPADTGVDDCDIIKTVFSRKGVHRADEPYVTAYTCWNNTVFLPRHSFSHSLIIHRTPLPSPWHLASFR